MEMDGGIGFTMSWNYLIPLNCTLKKFMMENVKLWAFYSNKNWIKIYEVVTWVERHTEMCKECIKPYPWDSSHLAQVTIYCKGCTEGWIIPIQWIVSMFPPLLPISDAKQSLRSLPNFSCQWSTQLISKALHTDWLIQVPSQLSRISNLTVHIN